MILLLGAALITILAIVAIIRSKKPLRLILLETKFELYYNYLGSRCIFEDILMRNKNKTELIQKPGKIAVITGGARGIGKEVVRMLLKCDLTIIIGCRNVQAGEMLAKKYRDDGIKTGICHIYQLDISSTKSVRNFAKKISENHQKIHYLINNAGIMFGPYIESCDGFESQFATNYLGHFLLTHLLLDQMHLAGEISANARIINVSSCAHEVGTIDLDDINQRKCYIPTIAYAQSKLAQVMFSNYLQMGIFNGKHGLHIQTHTVHPGIVNTDLFNGTHLKNFAPWLPTLIFKSPEQGAISIVHACLAPGLEGKGATYIHNCRPIMCGENAQSTELQQKLFEFTLKLLKIDNFGQTD